MRHALKQDAITQVNDKDIDYEIDSPNQFYGAHFNSIPIANAVQGARMFYGSKFINQAFPLVKPDVPWVQNLMDGDKDGRSFDDWLGNAAGAVRAKDEGVIQSVGKDHITMKLLNGEKKKIPIYNNFAFNRKTSIHNTPLVKKGDPIKPGQMLAKSNYTDDNGTLALGLNAKTALIPYRGYSVEDAIVVSESFAKRLAAETMYTDELEYKRGVKGGVGHYKGIFPNKFTNKQYAKLNEEGVVQPGQVVEFGDPIILATKPKPISSASQKLGKLSNHMKNAKSDASLVWDMHEPGEVTDVVKTKSGYKVSVKAITPANAGDKIVYRSGNKGTISKIIPDKHMPRTAKGEPLEVLLNPLSLPSRVNSSLVYELLLGKVAEKRGKPFKLPAFNSKDTNWYDLVQAELDKDGIDSTEEIFDPQLNKKIRKPVTVGNGYIWRLHHTAHKGFSARSQGAYDINEQPLKGGDEMAKSKRVGGLESHGLLSAGAYGVLKDMSTLRGARNDPYWQQLREGYDPQAPDTPMVFNKFKTLLQGAGYHARQTNKKGELRLGPMTEKILDELGSVPIENPGMIDTRQLAKGNVTPVKGGLFDDRLTFQNRYGHIKLPFEIPNPAFEEPVRKILGLTEKQFRAIMAGEEELPPELVKRMQRMAKQAAPAPTTTQPATPAPKPQLQLPNKPLPKVKKLQTGNAFQSSTPVATCGVRG